MYSIDIEKNWTRKLSKLKKHAKKGFRILFSFFLLLFTFIVKDLFFHLWIEEWKWKEHFILFVSFISFRMTDLVLSIVFCHIDLIHILDLILFVSVEWIRYYVICVCCIYTNDRDVYDFYFSVSRKIFRKLLQNLYKIMMKL